MDQHEMPPSSARYMSSRQSSGLLSSIMNSRTTRRRSPFSPFRNQPPRDAVPPTHGESSHSLQFPLEPCLQQPIFNERNFQSRSSAPQKVSPSLVTRHQRPLLQLILSPNTEVSDEIVTVYTRNRHTSAVNGFRSPDIQDLTDLNNDSDLEIGMVDASRDLEFISSNQTALIPRSVRMRDRRRRTLRSSQVGRFSDPLTIQFFTSIISSAPSSGQTSEPVTTQAGSAVTNQVTWSRHSTHTVDRGGILAASRINPTEDCVICLSEKTNRSVLIPCMHTYCYGCIARWVSLNPICPLCKCTAQRIIHSITSDSEFMEMPVSAVHQTSVSLSDFRWSPRSHVAQSTRQSPPRTRFNSSYWTTQPSQRHERVTSTDPCLDHLNNLVSSALPDSFNHALEPLLLRQLVYLRNLYSIVLPSDGSYVSSRRIVTPSFIAENEAVRHRLTKFVRRELRILAPWLAYDYSSANQRPTPAVSSPLVDGTPGPIGETFNCDRITSRVMEHISRVSIFNTQDLVELLSREELLAPPLVSTQWLIHFCWEFQQFASFSGTLEQYDDTVCLFSERYIRNTSSQVTGARLNPSLAVYPGRALRCSSQFQVFTYMHRSNFLIVQWLYDHLIVSRVNGSTNPSSTDLLHTFEAPVHTNVPRSESFCDLTRSSNIDFAHSLSDVRFENSGINRNNHPFYRRFYTLVRVLLFSINNFTIRRHAFRTNLNGPSLFFLRDTVTLFNQCLMREFIDQARIIEATILLMDFNGSSEHYSTYFELLHAHNQALSRLNGILLLLTSNSPFRILSHDDIGGLLNRRLFQPPEVILPRSRSPVDSSTFTFRPYYEDWSFLIRRHLSNRLNEQADDLPQSFADQTERSAHVPDESCQIVDAYSSVVGEEPFPERRISLSSTSSRTHTLPMDDDHRSASALSSEITIVAQTVSSDSLSATSLDVDSEPVEVNAEADEPSSWRIPLDLSSSHVSTRNSDPRVVPSQPLSERLSRALSSHCHDRQRRRKYTLSESIRRIRRLQRIHASSFRHPFGVTDSRLLSGLPALSNAGTSGQSNSPIAHSRTPLSVLPQCCNAHKIHCCCCTRRSSLCSRRRRHNPAPVATQGGRNFIPFFFLNSPHSPIVISDDEVASNPHSPNPSTSEESPPDRSRLRRSSRGQFGQASTSQQGCSVETRARGLSRGGDPVKNETYQPESAEDFYQFLKSLQETDEEEEENDVLPTTLASASPDSAQTPGTLLGHAADNLRH